MFWATRSPTSSPGAAGRHRAGPGLPRGLPGRRRPGRLRAPGADPAGALPRLPLP
ncbi:hypothetical protein LT493_14905 [Streptomyces tricolor]|nr:hypothetical protein [Streptomyces tricolor]